MLLSILPLLISTVCALQPTAKDTTKACVEQSTVERRAISRKDILPDDYDRMLPPKERGNAVTVAVKVSVLNILSVDEEKQAFSTEIFFHQYWRDARLSVPDGFANGRVVLDETWKRVLWTPDTYFKNALDGKVTEIGHPYLYFVLHNDSSLFMAARMTLTLACEMDLTNYPHDSQECTLNIMSLQNTIDTVDLVWREFQITNNILLSQFSVSNYSHAHCTRHYKIGTFSCIEGKLQLQRRLGFYLINKYIPSILIVCMSFVGFWIPAEAYPARVMLSVVSLLAIVTQQYASASMPSVSYVMALHIWMLACIGFVFFTLLEYALVICHMVPGWGLNIRGCAPILPIKKLFLPSAKKAALQVNMSNEDAASPATETRVVTTPPRPKTPLCGTSETYIQIDRTSRFLFPVLFVMHCLVYWMVFAVK